MPRQWESPSPIASGVITGGVKSLVTLKCPSRCQLQKLVVKQTAGTLVTFTIDIFSSLAKATAFVSPGTDDLNRVTAQIASDSAGKLLKLFDTVQTAAYENKDGGPSNKLYKIYAVITPAGVAADLNFDFTLGVLVAPDCE